MASGSGVTTRHQIGYAVGIAAVALSGFLHGTPISAQTFETKMIDFNS
jgi:hypothetical protein